MTDDFGKMIADSVRALVQRVVDEQLELRLPEAIEAAFASPWLDVKAAAAYLGISPNALRKRVDARLVPVHRDAAGRLRFHRSDLDETMKQRTPRRGRR